MGDLEKEYFQILWGLLRDDGDSICKVYGEYYVMFISYWRIIGGLLENIL